MEAIDIGANSLGTEKISVLFIKYSIPAVLGMIFLGLNSIIDGFFVGNFIGANALASVNIAMPFTSLMIAVSVIIGIGTQSVIGRKLGEGNIQEAKKSLKTAIVLILGISLALSIIAVIFTPQIASMLGANAELMELTTTYIKYLGIFLPLLGLMLVFDYVLKVIGKPMYAMVALAIAVVGNIILNYLFIVQLNLGIKGAALATGLAYSTAFIIAIIPFVTGKTSFVLWGGSFDFRIAYNIIYNGSSEGLAELGTGITTFLFNIALMKYVGELGVAAFTAISYLSFMGTNILLGLSDGVGSIISYNYGSRQMKRVKKTLAITAVVSLIIGVIIFVAMFSFSKGLIAIFLESSSPEVLDFAINGAKIYAFAFLVSGLNIITSGYFTAIGNPKKSAIIALSKGIIWIVIGISIWPVVFGISGIWLTVPIAEVITNSLSIYLIYKHFKKV